MSEKEFKKYLNELFENSLGKVSFSRIKEKTKLEDLEIIYLLEKIHKEGECFSLHYDVHNNLIFIEKI